MFTVRISRKMNPVSDTFRIRKIIKECILTKNKDFTFNSVGGYNNLKNFLQTFLSIGKKKVIVKNMKTPRSVLLFGVNII